MKLSLGISSCPNDTFMFDALVNKKIDTRGYEFDLIIADVEQLNQMAFKSENDITKMSYHCFFKSIANYQMLNSGGALGDNCGPLIISKKKIYPDELHDCKIAIPGENTTAKLLMDIFFPNIKEYKNYLFSDIEEVVLQNECDAGLVIHETRFVYKEKGLKLVTDLGKLWEEKHMLPTPLGGIAIKRNLDSHIKKDISELIAESIEYSYKNPNSPLKFMKENAVELSEEVMFKHVELYVSSFSLNYGNKGRSSVEKLYEEFIKFDNLNQNIGNIFI